MKLPRANMSQALLDRDSLIGLGKLVVPDYEKRLHWYQREIADALEGMLRFTRWRGKKGGYARVLISMPARHGKSLHGVELLPALTLGCYPDMKVMVATATANLAKKSVRNTRLYMQSPEYKTRYPTRIGRVEEFIGKGADGKIDAENTALMFRTLKRDRSGAKHVKAQGYYMAQGIGGSFIGQGADIICMDDFIKNAAQALNPSYQKKIWDFYLSTLSQRGDHPWVAQLYIGHRWTSPDFVDELKDHWRSESTAGHELPIKDIRLSALAEAPLPEYDPREEGEGLDHEWMRPRAWYEGQRDALLSRRPWVWAGMWQQRPTMDGSKFFQPGDWLWYGRAFQLAQKLLLVDFSIDAAMSEDGESFYVINVFGYLDAGARAGSNAGEHFFWLDERRGHWTIERMYIEFEELWRKWTRALPDQFDEDRIIDLCPELYSLTRVEDDSSKHHARPRIWVENKAAGHSFISRYRAGAVITNVTSKLTEAELDAVAVALYAVPKIHSKKHCYLTAAQVVALGRVWLPQESFGEDPTFPHLPLVDAKALGVTWVRDEEGNIKKATIQPNDIEDGGWVHELGNFPREPDDRRDVLAQAIICRTPWLGPHLLGSR